MQVSCLTKDFSLDDSERFIKIAELRETLKEKLSLAAEKIIGLTAFNKESNTLHYGLIIDYDISSLNLDEFGLTESLAAIPNADWDVYEGKASSTATMYEAVEMVQEIRATIETFSSDGSCRLLVI